MKKNRLLALAGLFVLFATPSGAATLTEDFSTNPLQNGWGIFGDARLFQWDSTGQHLAVTWDSSLANSYFYRPLGTILAIADDFSVEVNMELNNAVADGTFELGIGPLNFSDATNKNFCRPIGTTP